MKKILSIILLMLVASAMFAVVASAINKVAEAATYTIVGSIENDEQLLQKAASESDDVINTLGKYAEKIEKVSLELMDKLCQQYPAIDEFRNRTRAAVGMPAC